MKYNKLLLVLTILASVSQLNAQIGYQVSLLNSATGEPRANETVNVDVEITNSEGTIICSETKSATTNDFGVLAMQIGNASTFENVDWSKLPFYVSATVDGIMIGKSQILNVPVAEAAKTLVNVSPDQICKTWSRSITVPISKEESMIYTYTLSLHPDNTYTAAYSGDGSPHSADGHYYVLGNIIFFAPSTEVNHTVCYSMAVYDKNNNKLVVTRDSEIEIMH